jgi:hypothetical protein
VFIVSNLWLWFIGLIFALMYFHTKREIAENQEKLFRFKKLSHKLFLMYGAACIFLLLASIWIIH